MHLILPAPTPLDLNEGAVLAALLFKSKVLPAAAEGSERRSLFGR